MRRFPPARARRTGRFPERSRRLVARQGRAGFVFRGESAQMSAARPFKSSIDYAALGNRLRAYRVGAGLQAEDVAERLGVSRAVVYRMEKGEIVKIEMLERLAHLLNASLASLLGVEVEYYSNALGLFE